MKRLFALFVLMLPAAMVGQTQPFTNLYAAGPSFNQGASPRLAGTALYAHSVDNSGTYAFTVFDAIPTSVTPFSVTTNVGAGLAQKLFTIGKVPVFVPTSAGVSFSGSNTGWAWSTGALVAVKLKGNWRVLPNVRLQKSSVGGDGYKAIAGVLIGWGQ